MKRPVFACADAALAGILLLILLLGSLPGLLTVEHDSGFIVRTGGVSQSPIIHGAPLPVKNAHVNPNRADARQLATLPGMTPALADAVVRFRGVHGAFRRLEELQKVSGIGPKRLQKMVPYLTLGEEEMWGTK